MCAVVARRIDWIHSDFLLPLHIIVKFENIMFENRGIDAEIKVIDFGLSKKFLPGNTTHFMQDGVGTLYSMAPQVLQGIYTSQADMWAVGVIAYMLLSAHRPFYNKRRNVMIDKIMRCDFSLTRDYWKPISDEAKDMVNNLLVLDPRLRMDADKALQHRWLSRDFALIDRKPRDDVSAAVGECLVNFKYTSALKKIALNVSDLRDSRLNDVASYSMCVDAPFYRLAGHCLPIEHRRHSGIEKSI